MPFYDRQYTINQLETEDVGVSIPAAQSSAAYSSFIYIINIIKKIIFQGSGGRTERFVFTTLTFGQNFFISRRIAAACVH